MPMSRRKQLNPKPAKRETPDLEELQVAANLPSSQLYLREFGGESLVLSKHKLRAGTVLGTYKGAPPTTSSHEDCTSLLTINRSDGGSPVNVMLENEGHWLKLMRTANLPTEANICLRITGEDIVCAVTKDVNKEVELKVTCHIVDKENAQEFDHSSLSPESHLPSPFEQYCHSDSVDEEPNDRPTSGRVITTPEEMLFLASQRIENFNEDMHSRSVTQSDSESIEMEKSRNYNADSDCENNEVLEEECSSRVRVSPSIDDKIHKRKMTSDRKETHSSDGNKLSDINEHLEPSEVMPKEQRYKEGERFHKCQRCNFETQDQQALEKHMQSHRNPPSKRPSSKMTNAKSYCDNCKIQFMSIDTYHVHKQLYCKSRHDKDEDPSSPPLQEPTPIHAAVGFKPGPDTVIIRGGVSGGVANSMIQPQAIYAAISTNPLILLPCSLVNGQSLVPQGGVMTTGAPGIVVQTGIACPTIVEKPSATSKLKDESLPSRKTSHPIMHFSEDTLERPLTNSMGLLRKRKMSEGDVLNLKKACTSASVHPLDLEKTQKESQSAKSMSQDIPLDLSLKKFPDVSCRSPVKRKESVISPSCHSPTNQTSSDYETPQRSSVVHSRITLSPSNSYSNDSVNCYPTQIPVVLARQSSIDSNSPLPPVIHVDTSLDKHLPHSIMPPPKILKQGNNVCEECNIVFYKYDNYLAHKRHYCAYRRQQLSALAATAALNQEHSSDDNNSNHSGIHESGSSQSYQLDDNSKTSSRREPSVEHFRSVITKTSSSVYCCDACGVKFSTSDNLEAHQTYYCIKKCDSAMSKKIGNRRENSVSPKGLELPFDGPEEWKCNYCDATCSSYDTISRHLSTHSELKGYRCIVCGYKGNTMRGMRNHACEHLTEGSVSIEEFILTKVISESGSIAPIIPHAVNHSDDESDNSKEINDAFRRDKTSSERAGSSSKSNMQSSDHSESNEISNSPRTVEKTSRDHVPNSNSPIKMESSVSSGDANCSSSHDSVNPSAFCDVVIKTENEQSSGEDSSPKDGHSKSFIKYEPEPEYDSEDQPQDLSKSPPGQSTSVIRRASDIEGFTRYMPSVKRKGKSPIKHNSELKYCKVCDISFSHLSNFIAHKKFYCVSRVIQNCIQEAATVQ